MQKLYFINDWWARKPLYIRVMIILPIYVMYMTVMSGSLFNYELNHSLKVILATALILISLILIFRSLIKSIAKNVFIYGQNDDFSLKINGNKIEFESKHISEISLDEHYQLQIKRINRVDSFDLSNIRKEDRDKLVTYIKDFVSNEVEIKSTPILS
ncbi:MAG: hypothetical protein WBG46_06450 [Nonlabens sp.]